MDQTHITNVNNNNNNIQNPIQNNTINETSQMNESYLSPERNNGNNGNNNFDTTHIEFPPQSKLDKEIAFQQHHYQQQHQPISPNRFNFNNNNNIYLNEELDKMNEELKELELQEKELLRKKHKIDGICIF